MKLFAKLACAVAGAAMLGGCQSFPLTSWMFKGKRPLAATETLMAASPSGALDEGRAFLRNGNLSAAIASFNIAQLDESARAEATNGLAVAYAKLGRADLAERYFRAAVAEAPDNPKFAANLLRLQTQVLLAKRAESDRTLTAVGPVVAPRAPMAAAEPLDGPVRRISRGEIHVASRVLSNDAPLMAVAYREAAKPETKQSSARVAESDVRVATASSKNSHPVTIVFGE